MYLPPHSTYILITINLGNITNFSVYKPLNERFSFPQHLNLPHVEIADFNYLRVLSLNEDAKLLGRAEDNGVTFILDQKRPPSFNNGRMITGYNPELSG